MNPALWTLLGTIVGGLIAVGKDWFLDHVNRSRLATYSAVRIVCSLDLFVEECLRVAEDAGEDHPNERGEPERSLTTRDPSAPTFADDIDWKSLDPDLTYRILSLPARIDDAKRAIDFMFEVVAFPPDYREGIDERRIRFAKIGLSTLDIVAVLRSKYKLTGTPAIHLSEDEREWSPQTRLPEIIHRIEAEERVRREKIELRRANRLSTTGGPKDDGPITEGAS